MNIVFNAGFISEMKYLDNTNSDNLIKELKEKINSLTASFKKAEAYGNKGKHTDTILKLSQHMECKTLNTFVKHHGFSDEREVRITKVFAADKILNNKQRFFINNTGRISYKLPFNEDSDYNCLRTAGSGLFSLKLEEIRLGPLNNTPIESVANILSWNNFNNVNVEKSTIPLR